MFLPFTPGSGGNATSVIASSAFLPDELDGLLSKEEYLELVEMVCETKTMK